jgi:SAM-dependent methyltransferase
VRTLIKRWMRPAMPALESARRTLTGVAGVGKVDFGELRKVAPISRKFGVDRGLPIDRFYVERFLQQNAALVRGHVLEIGEDTYTRRFGADRVLQSDVLHVSADNPRATIVADLQHAPHVASGQFDAIILTQTLQLIFDVPAALRTLHRILKPGGALLVTVPGLTSVATGSVWGSTWYWSFTELALRKLLEHSFGEAVLDVQTHGNVLVAMAFLQGLATQELDQAELEARDPDYPVIITARAIS